MTEKEARMVLEYYRMTDEDTDESYGHPVIRCVGKTPAVDADPVTGQSDSTLR